MSNFENGDRVRITTKNSQYSGKEALVINIHTDKTVLVRIDGNQSLSGFFPHEIEPLWAEGVPIVHIDVELSSAEEDYVVGVNLTPEEARGVGKFIAAAQKAASEKVQFGPFIQFKTVK